MKNMNQVHWVVVQISASGYIYLYGARWYHQRLTDQGYFDSYAGRNSYLYNVVTHYKLTPAYGKLAHLLLGSPLV